MSDIEEFKNNPIIQKYNIGLVDKKEEILDEIDEYAQQLARANSDQRWVKDLQEFSDDDLYDFLDEEDKIIRSKVPLESVQKFTSTPMPKLIVFDCDYTLWMPGLYEMLPVGGVQPFVSPDDGYTLRDRLGNQISLAPEARHVITGLIKTKEYREGNLALGLVAKANYQDKIADVLEKLRLKRRGRIIGRLFDYKMVQYVPRYDALMELKKRAKVRFNEMLYFDDAMQGILAAEALGIPACHVGKQGVTMEDMNRALATYRAYNADKQNIKRKPDPPGDFEMLAALHRSKVYGPVTLTFSNGQRQAMMNDDGHEQGGDSTVVAAKRRSNEMAQGHNDEQQRFVTGRVKHGGSSDKHRERDEYEHRDQVGSNVRSNKRKLNKKTMRHSDWNDAEYNDDGSRSWSLFEHLDVQNNMLLSVNRRRTSDAHRTDDALSLAHLVTSFTALGVLLTVVVNAVLLVVERKRTPLERKRG